jgi:hypothetical protein
MFWKVIMQELEQALIQGELLERFVTATPMSHVPSKSPPLLALLILRQAVDRTEFK